MMLCHTAHTVVMDDRVVRLIVPKDWYYTQEQAVEQEQEWQRLSGPCRTRYAGRDEIERMLRR